MRALVAIILTICLYVPSFALGQRTPNWIAGSSLANGLLLRLANPKGTDFRAGIINTAAEIGVLVSPVGDSSVAEYFRGYSTARQSDWNLTWTVREQLDASIDNLVFEVIRKAVSSSSCPDLDDSLSRFYAMLESALQSPVSLTQIPQERRRESITVDGTSYVIQIWTGERLIAIYPDRDIDKAMDNASAELMRVIGRCSSNQTGTVEEHRAW